MKLIKKIIKYIKYIEEEKLKLSIKAFTPTNLF